MGGYNIASTLFVMSMYLYAVCDEHVYLSSTLRGLSFSYTFGKPGESGNHFCPTADWILLHTHVHTRRINESDWSYESQEEKRCRL